MANLKRGPRPPVDKTPLPYEFVGKNSEKFTQFCEQFLVIPKGKGVGGPLILRPFQVELISAIIDPDIRPSIAGVMCPRGNAKTTLMAALALFEAFTGPFGNEIPCVAVDERQAHLLLDTAAAMVALNPELSSRCRVFRDRIEVSGRNSSITALPAEAKRLEGLGNFSLAIADEIGVIGKDTWQTLLLGLGKVENATVVGIGTPSVHADSVLGDLRAYAQGDGAFDPSFVWVEFSADAFTGIHPVDCRHCWSLANPALGDFLSESAMVALLPPKTSEGAFRRARLCQFVPENLAPFIPVDVWDGLATGVGVPDGSEVVIALDGSHSSDYTALLVGTVAEVPHFDVVKVFRPEDMGGRISVLAVEDCLRAAGKRWCVTELVLDPFRWRRTAEVLQSEGWTVSEFNFNSAARVTAATTDVYGAAVAQKFTHSGDAELRAHVLGATVLEADNGGLKLSKANSKRTGQKVDLAACLLMCFSRCSWRFMHKRKRGRVVSYRR